MKPQLPLNWTIDNIYDWTIPDSVSGRIRRRVGRRVGLTQDNLQFITL